MSWPKESTRRRTQSGYSAGICVLPVKRVYRNASSSSGSLTALSHSSAGFGGRDIILIFGRSASRKYRPEFPRFQMDRFWGRTKSFLLSRRSSIAISHPILFPNFFENFQCGFEYFSSVHWSHVRRQLLSGQPPDKPWIFQYLWSKKLKHRSKLCDVKITSAFECLQVFRLMNRK